MALVPALVCFVLLAQTDHAAEGRKALEANNFTLAAEHYQKAVDADPKDWTARFHLGLALSLLNRDSEAMAAYRKVLEDEPTLYEARVNLGQLLVRQHPPLHQEAIPLLSAAVEAKPKEFRPRLYLARARAAAGAASDAEREYREALAIDPTSAEAAVDLARLYAAQGKLDAAAPLYQQAAASDPEFRRALLELAGHLEAARQKEQAIALYRQFPEDPAARERLGHLLIEGGQAADAIPELEESYKQSPTNANRLALATAYLRSKQLPKAVPLLEKAAADEPNNVELRLYLGRAHRDLRSYQAAAREFFRATQLKPDSREAWNELAGMLYLLENYPQALAAFDKAKALSTEENPAYYYFRAIILDRMKDYKGALPAYQRFLELSQNRSPDEEFKARQRIKVIQKELSKR